MKVALAQINTTIGDLPGNVDRCLAAIEAARRQNTDLVVLPEMAVPGYPPRDILFDASFIEAVAEANHDLAHRVQDGPPAIVGTLMPAGHQPPEHPGLYNAAVLLNKGEVQLVAAKRLLPAYDVFFEPRWFVPGPALPPVAVAGQQVGVLICEDVWDEGYNLHPPADLRAAGAEVLVCISASPYRHQILEQRLYHARRQQCPLVYVNSCGANDELIFDGRSFALNAKGEIISQLAGFEEEVRVVELESKTIVLDSQGEQPPQKLTSTSFILKDKNRPHPNPLPLEEGTVLLPSPCGRGAGGESLFLEKELYQALVLGVRDFARKNRLERAFVGLSGGVDSAVAAVIAAEALGPEQVTAVAIPSRFTNPRSTACAKTLAQALGINFKVVELESLHQAAETVLGDLLAGGTTAENIQARLRGMILMSFVNRYGGMLLNTSNKTELALGYATLYGDMAGSLCPIADVTKPQVVALAHWINAQRGLIPPFILERPPSAELRPDQVDPFDYATVAPEMERLVRENRSNPTLRRSEHKRWQMGVVLKVSEKSFGTGRMVPITRR
jgi:NAD+ synthase (glutamine-hydrolysing)